MSLRHLLTISRAALVAAGLVATLCPSRDAAAQPAVADDARAFTIAGEALSLEAPASWKRVQPKSNMIETEFSIPAAEGDATPGRMTVMGAGGSVQANIDRWYGQFTQPDGSDTQPSYLGTVIHDLPGVGTRSNPDLPAIAAAKPDLILGSQALTPDAYGALTAIAPTVFSAAPGAIWQANLRMVGAATGRLRAADDLIAGFVDRARKAGEANDATHFQASVVQLTDTTLRVFGADTFPGSVLAAVGVDRPAAQRFTDKPYLEIGLDGSPDFSAADGDIVYMSFASPAAKERAPALLESPAWRKLSANRDNRVFVVNNEVWQTGQGLIAARGVVDDLRWLNAPIN